jgi:biotin carboxylase
LGGSPFQVPAIQHARERGYYVITCDYLPDNPGHQFAHEYHNCSTTDFDGILKVAQECRINGIVAYASDPSAPTAAYVAEKLGLPTNPLSAVDVLTNKDKFRRFLSNHGFRVPLARGFSTVESLIEGCAAFQFPVMVKPVDSSGSKGVSKVTEPGLLAKAFAYAMPFSRAKRVIMEEYVEKNGYQVAGDGFLVGGKLVFRSFANEHFNVSCNPFVPIGESWPYNRPARVHDRIHEEIQRALTLLGMQMGALNFDIRVDADDNPILMEIGPRNGGNLIPQVTRYATGVDMVDYTIESALGHDCSALRMAETRGFWSCFMVHSKQTGTVGHVSIDPALAKNNIVEQSIPIKPGDKVQSFQGSNGTLGTMILKYSSMDEMLEKMDNMDKYVRVDVKDA